MTFVYFWPVCTLLLVGVEGKQHGLAVPEIVNVQHYRDWKMNIEWRDNVINSMLKKVTCDIEIFHSEQMRLVYNETKEVKTNRTHTWSWTSPMPLQCTSHSVRLRCRDSRYTSDWTPFYTLEGADVDEVMESKVYPQDHVVRVGDSITFCCILAPESLAGFSCANCTFKIRISNRTYVTEPIRYNMLTPSQGSEVICHDSGIATYFTGYEPDVQNLTCETRDLRSVECHWSIGRKTGDGVRSQYKINEKECFNFEELKKCELDENIDKGVMNWTLTASNALGVKILSDIADPKHRVRLKAPKLTHATLVHARNATLEWKWSEKLKYDDFPMTCRAEVNGLIVKEMFNGSGLKSLFLADLHPFTQYMVRVQCAGWREYFYKWGDWSDLITFSTKEDIPEAPDVWLQVYDGHTYVVWENLTMTKSHGIITGYELLLGNKEQISKTSNEQCHKLSPGSAGGDHLISVSVRNSVGVSPPSSITLHNVWSDSGINSSHIKGHKNKENQTFFNMSWEPSPISSCGYVVDWFPTFSAKKCISKWKKIPSHVSNTTIISDFEKGVKYTLSVYACTSGAPALLQWRQGYVEELAPSGKVGNLKAEQHSFGVELSWDDVPEEQQNGDILGYIVSYKHSAADTTGQNAENSKKGVFIEEPPIHSRVYKVSNLQSGSYTFRVQAFTSAGRGPESEISRYVDLEVYKLIVSIFTTLGTAACAIAIIVFCCFKREWLKSKLYPDIPKPVVSEAWFTEGFPKLAVIDKLLLAESEVLMVKNPEDCLQVMPEVQNRDEEVNLVSKDQKAYCDDTCESQTNSVKPSYMVVPCTGIQNPTYNIPLTHIYLTDVVLDYMPQIQNGIQQPSDVTVIEMDYQPQSLITLNSNK